MIKASELRIGNWVFIDNGERPKYAYDISAHDIEEIEGCGTDTFPIHLTPEILEQCGFKGTDHGWKIKDQFFLQIQEHGPWINGTPVGEIKYMVYKSGIGAIKEVKYLHDLQNLYFAVMDAELPVNLISSLSKS